ncbi:MAG: neutral/alkaline non-lysosomal ceramidase N-terminal domain-containing protein [Planctomycetota bacterium]
MRFLATFALALAMAHSSSAGTLRAGFAKEDLTPDRNVPLAGYGARKGALSTGVHDKVWARAAVFESEDHKAAILSVDMVGVSGEVREKLVEGVCKDLDIASHNILFCATHNHSGPGALSRNPLIQAAAGKFDEALFNDILARLERCIRAADARLAPATLAVGRATFADLSRNRAVPGGPVDADGAVAIARGADGKVLGTIVDFAAHGTVLGAENMLVSGDWPGAMSAALERRWEGSVALFLAGAEGDQSPATPEGKDDWERAEKMGGAVAEAAAAAIAKLGNGTDDAVVRGHAQDFDMPPTAFQGEWPTHTTVQVFDLGPLRLFCFPGEPCVAVGRAATALCTDKDRVAAVVACANEHLGYFVPEDYYFAGGYESTLCFLGPRCGDWFVARFRELLELKTEAPPVPNVRTEVLGRFKKVVARGTPYEIGLGHGRALTQEIRTHGDFWRDQLTGMAGVLPIRTMLPFPDSVDPAPLLYPLLAIRCRLLLRECEPALLEEMRGIADGAGVAFDEIVFLNTWLAVADQTDPTALFRLKPGCATAASGKWLAHNADWPPQKEFPDVAALIVAIPKDGRAVAMMTLAGCVGAPSAMNADGVACAVDSLPAPDDTGLEGTPVWLSVRAALQFNRVAPDVAEAIELAPGTAGYLITIKDPEETIRLEVSATHSERDSAEPRPAPKKDRKRREAVEAFLKDNATPKGSELRDLFGDREKGVLSPSTRMSVVMDVEKKRWWVAAGPGSEIDVEKFVEVDLKAVLAK